MSDIAHRRIMFLDLWENGINSVVFRFFYMKKLFWLIKKCIIRRWDHSLINNKTCCKKKFPKKAFVFYLTSDRNPLSRFDSGNMLTKLKRRIYYRYNETENRRERHNDKVSCGTAAVCPSTPASPGSLPQIIRESSGCGVGSSERRRVKAARCSGRHPRSYRRRGGVTSTEG